jgi:uncharacterized membrane protein
MRVNRLEAFSDGVYAIVITLLVLDLRIPDVPYSGLAEALSATLPRVAAYLLSFIVVGLYWVFHYIYIERIKSVNGTLIAINLLGLLLISFMPIPTSLIGRYPLQAWPIVLYGVCLIGINMTGMATLIYLRQNPYLLHESMSHSDFKQQLRVYIWVNVPYILAVAIAFIVPVASYLIFFVILVAIGINTWRQLNTRRQAA